MKELGGVVKMANQMALPASNQTHAKPEDGCDTLHGAKVV